MGNIYLNFADDPLWYLGGNNVVYPDLSDPDCEYITHFFEFGENLLDVTIENAINKYITVYGVYAEDKVGRIIGSAENSYKSDALIQKYGVQRGVVDLGRIDIDYLSSISNFNAELDRKRLIWTETHLKDYGNKLTVKGLDGYYINAPKFFIDGVPQYYDKPVFIGEAIRVTSQPHNLNQANICLSMSIDYFDHQNDQYIIGPYLTDDVYDPKITDS